MTILLILAGFLRARPDLFSGLTPRSLIAQVQAQTQRPDLPRDQAESRPPSRPGGVPTSNDLSLSISPPLAEITLQPGKSVVSAFNIKNEGAIDLEVTPTLADVTTDADGNSVVAFDKPSSFRAFARLQNLDKSLDAPFILSAGGTDQLVLRIEIPKEAQERDYYQVLLLKARPPSQPSSAFATAAGVTSKTSAYVGVHLLISISKTGVNTGALTITQLNAPKIIDMFAPLSIKVFAKNTGGMFTKAQGEVRVRSQMTNQVVKVFPVLAQNVLAGSARALSAAQKNPEDEKSLMPAPFRYKPLALFGPYTVTADIHAENQPATVVTTRVWALPISPLFFAVAISTILWIVRKWQENQDMH